MEVLNF